MTTETVRVPTSDISVQWNRSAGSYNYALIDEYPTPNDMDYVTINANNKVDQLGFSSPGVPTGAEGITLKLFFRSKWQNYDNQELIPRLWVGGAYYEGAEVAEGAEDVWGEDLIEFAVNPATGTPWTVDDVNGSGAHPLQAIGYRLRRTLGVRIISQFNLRVLYEPPVVSGARSFII